MGSRNLVLGGSPDPPTERGNLGAPLRCGLYVKILRPFVDICYFSVECNHAVALTKRFKLFNY